ncbi:MAG: hypothetical protein WB643_04865, partial [Candidatus Bathyarchaeia archaeon]
MVNHDPGTLPRWDISNVYPALDSEQFKKAFADLKVQINAIDAYIVDHKISRAPANKPETATGEVKSAIDEYLALTNAALRLYSTLQAYVGSYVSTDSYNTVAKRLQSELEMVGVRLQKQEVFFKGWVGTIASLLPQALAQAGVAQAHGFYLRETAEQSRFLMTDAEESLAADLELSGSNAWGKMQGTVCSQVNV